MHSIGGTGCGGESRFLCLVIILVMATVISLVIAGPYGCGSGGTRGSEMFEWITEKFSESEPSGIPSL